MLSHFELEAFGAWLRDKRLATDLAAPHFVRWVERFARFESSHGRAGWRDSLHAFAESLEALETPSWQVRQAADAVSLFFDQFSRRNETPVHVARDVFTTDGALQEMHRLMRLRRYSTRTEQCYMGWARRFLEFVKRPQGPPPTTTDAKYYLTHLATCHRVSASTQNQAFNALLFLYRQVLSIPLGDMSSTVRAKRGPRLPVVLTVAETRAVIEAVEGTPRLILELIYGAGLRVTEAVTLRVKDLDFDGTSITVRSGKGDKDRVTLLPCRLKPSLLQHLERVRALHQKDLSAGAGEVPLPGALGRKYPGVGRQWGWQWVFPSGALRVDDSGVIRRWHASTGPVQQAMRDGVRRAGIAKHATVHTLRHCFATHLLLQGVDIHRIQVLLGHRSIETTMIYIHLLHTMAPDVTSPLDRL